MLRDFSLKKRHFLVLRTKNYAEHYNRYMEGGTMVAKGEGLRGEANGGWKVRLLIARHLCASHSVCAYSHLPSQCD